MNSNARHKAFEASIIISDPDVFEQPCQAAENYCSAMSRLTGLGYYVEYFEETKIRNTRTYCVRCEGQTTYMNAGDILSRVDAGQHVIGDGGDFGFVRSLISHRQEI